MKYWFFIIFFALSQVCLGQILPKKGKLPSVTLKNIDGKTVSSDSFQNDGKPIVISFWATWCKPCILELNTIAEKYEELQKETGLKLIAVSIDDARSRSNVAPFVNGKGWDYEVYLDANSDLKRAMNVNNVPHTFLLNKDRDIVWQHTSYVPGDEKKLYELVRKVANNEEIKE
ncbi:MAG: TlpA family protein disulfide reductase [Bacteroidia bacterium]|nr:TlpA family protein disulfide reductase [Bacteroidia bacterium]